MFWWRDPFAGEAEHIATGKRGENIAEKYLRKLGYPIWDKNMRIGRRDEIDLIAYDNKERVLVFIEVKTRSTPNEDFHPLLNFTYKKRQSFQRAVRRWIARQEYEGGYRMDVICVMGGEVAEHIREVAWL
ncbi:YraN family protein [Candidatus Peregrinibacteria bacterium]|nr:YraN family protein [Candidatus Peregrinibacteria bacterium]